MKFVPELPPSSTAGIKASAPMPTDAEIRTRINAAFADVPRPAHFTDHPFCDECREHDETLNAWDRETLPHEAVGSAAWDPIAMTTPAGFTYYLPALARLALGTEHETLGWYGEQLIFHLVGDGPFNRRWSACSPEQRRAVHALLVHILETRAALAAAALCMERLHQAIDVWSVDEDLR